MKKALAICILYAWVVFMSGCSGEIEYPDGAEGLPTFTTQRTAQVIYDTRATTEYSAPETTVKNTSETTVATSVTEETTLVCETVPPVTETIPESISLSLEDVPNVDISEYYRLTQTSPTVSTTYTQQSVTTTVSAAVTGEYSGNVTAPSSATASVGDKLANTYDSNFTLHEDLKDGKISKYTGKPVISHPYSYYSLSDKHKKLYDKLVTAMLNCEERVMFTDDEQITFQELFDVYQLLYNDEYRLFYISTTIEYMVSTSSNYVVKMDLQYIYDSAEVEKMKAEIDSEADRILSGIGPQSTDYEIVKHIHDTIIKDCVYFETENMNSIYGCLVEDEALCQGYSKSFSYLCALAGIDSFTVCGIADEPHMWNIAKMDGEYYHVDLTWDDPDKTDFPDAVRYDFFGLTDERMKELRTIDKPTYEVPAANGKQYHYYYFNNLVAASDSEADAIIEREVLKAAETKSSMVQFMCIDDAVFKTATDRLFGRGDDNVIGVLEKIKPQAKNKYGTDQISHSWNEDTRIIKIFLEYQ